ncbi:hypothetical protein BP5796_02573 [Coleophoma crateriformis]|uniref:Uncharacterized protein n=1 Tax=Coleophoma crateriformis TaxID=565419 RepID=A0A3D8T080_9HELO|nr:hypothetical protein BP5796_02573 [Coleophoma crateriformis]
MFSAIPNFQTYSHPQSFQFTPIVSSPLSSPPLRRSPEHPPLSPRDNNASSTRLTHVMSSPTPSKPTNLRSSSPINPASSSPVHGSAESTSRFSKRTTKSNPLIHNRGDGRETRRKLFLKKVREDSEDQRWKARGGDDEMMRTIWIAEQRRMQERRAGDLDAESLREEDFEEPWSSDEALADEIAKKEADEMEALLSSMEEQGHPYMPYMADTEGMDTSQDTMDSSMNKQSAASFESFYGCDDEEYDHLFMDVIQEEERQLSMQQPLSGDVEMDMS